MRLLIDTHVLIWWAHAEPLAADAHNAIGDPDSDVLVSVASIWEAEIKVAAGRLRLGRELADEATAHGFGSLDIRVEHAVAAARLPSHHGDPFDRMLVAQAQLEGLTIVTRDPVFSRYQVALLAA